mmetsp:Transcript_23525/g.61586  ORF Transcript_23525/g.61586 Transcript_23525/m.61586 type:complete len:556 (+) Transcript_23525:95-1762(+)
MGNSLSKTLKRGGKPKVVLFLGAGCSEAAGIPLARDIVNELRVEAKEPKLQPDDPVFYSFEVKKYIHCNADRQQLFVDKCRDKCQKTAPTAAHHQLAKAVKAAKDTYPGQMLVIVTTNFDALVEKALRKADLDPIVIDLQSSEECSDPERQLAQASRDNCVAVVKLLGDAAHRTVRLDLEDGKEVGAAIRSQLGPTARVVVAGYSGAEHGVKDMFKELFKDKGGLDPKNLIWCTPPDVRCLPIDDPRNVVFAWFAEKHSEHIKNADFAWMARRAEELATGAAAELSSTSGGAASAPAADASTENKWPDVNLVALPFADVIEAAALTTLPPDDPHGRPFTIARTDPVAPSTPARPGSAAPTHDTHDVVQWRWIGADRKSPTLRYFVHNEADKVKPLMTKAVAMWTEAQANITLVEASKPENAVFMVQCCRGVGTQHAVGFAPGEVREDAADGHALNSLYLDVKLFDLEPVNQVAVVAHELGRIMGLSVRRGGDVSSIMRADVATAPADEVQNDLPNADTNALRSLYGHWEGEEGTAKAMVEPVKIGSAQRVLIYDE